MSCEDERNTSDEQAHVAFDRQQKRDFWHTGSEFFASADRVLG